MLVLNEEQTLLQASARDFLTTKSPVQALRTLRDSRSADGFDRALWAEMAEMGWTGILVPEEFGGLDFGHVGAGIISEEMGRTLAASPFLSTAIMAAIALKRSGNAAQKAQWLPLIAAGKALFAIAVDETRKHDPAGTAMAATPHGNGFMLTGEKTFVADGHVADAIIVAARTSGEAGEPEGISLFIVDRHAEGLSVERTWLADSTNAARMTFDGVVVTGADALGEIGGGFALLEMILDAGRAALAAELSGLSQETFARTVDYLKNRKQFNRTIGSFQALQHRAAHLHAEIEVTRSAVLKALQTLDKSPAEAAGIVALAKAKAGQVATLAVQEGVQMHGGIGMTDQFDIGFFMKRARVAVEMLGDVNFHADRLAKRRGF
jgi:alkylation response protein AidB-like acyl-CoA dehydrogenase